MLGVVMVIARLKVDRSGADTEPHTEGVVRSKQRSNQADDAECDESESRRDERLRDDLILGVEPVGNQREAGETQAAVEHRPTDNAPAGHVPQTGHLAQIQLPGKAVHHGPGREEQHGLEEGVGEDVVRCAEGCQHTQPEEHVPQLRNRRIGEDALDVVLRHADRRRQERREPADPRDDGQSVFVQQHHRIHPRDEIDPRGHHRRSVNQGGDRRRTFHRIGKPNV